MIHVCSLARMHDTVASTGARHVVTLLRNTAQAVRPGTIAEQNHLLLCMDDIVEALDGYEAPAEAHVDRLIEFVTSWDRGTPLVVHCFAGISRSTAGAFISACALNPKRDELSIAQAMRKASITAMPNARLVAMADRILKRDGRMVRAVQSIGAGEPAYEAEPFRLDLE